MFSQSVFLFQVWNLKTMELIQELTGLNHWVRALVASERHLFSGSYQTIKVLSRMCPIRIQQANKVFLGAILIISCFEFGVMHVCSDSPAHSALHYYWSQRSVEKIVFRPLHTPLVSVVDSKKVITWWQTSLGCSVQQSYCKFLKTSKFEANLIQAMEFVSFKLFSITFLEQCRARKFET